jgi:type II restriction/modification system DNA methylase subunit YeeA
MREGGRVGFERVDWFNGGLFDDDSALPLTRDDIALVREAAARDWAEIDPSIFGTLFERGLDPDKRSQLGAHYTDRDKIGLIVEPVIMRPWLVEWATTKAEIERLVHQAEIAAVLDRSGRRGQAALRTRAVNEANALYRDFLDRLRAFRVLDPACGSGNFLYLALLALKDIEHRVAIEAETLGLAREFPRIGPEAVKGIEINPYAAELARVTVWIGEIQWMRRNGFDVGRNPILKPLDTIECRDAILNEDGTEAEWPDADVVIGNPPFLGNKAMLRTIGEGDVRRLRGAFADRLPGGVDLVTYWFEKARGLLEAQRLKRAGFVATQAIRRGANRKVLDRIAEVAAIFDAWADEPWVVDGAAVRVSLVCFGTSAENSILRLGGKPVLAIHADLSGGLVDLTFAEQLAENVGICFQGPVKVGAFDITGSQAREWLQMPLNPNGRSNADVVRPWLNGRDITDRPSDTWIVDFNEMCEADAALYEAPFAYVRTKVKPFRDVNNRARRRRLWWQHGETVPGLRAKAARVFRLIGTPRVAKHRFFVWIEPQVLPDSRVNVIARDDDVMFGLLHARCHVAWSLGLGGRHGVGNDPQYTPSTGFATFPFPEGLTPNRPAAEYGNDPRALAVAAAARRLNELRAAWLNPPDLVELVREVVLGFPDCIVPVSPKAATILKRRTLTNLYNERPAWLDNAHRELDAAVAAAYGWPADIAEEDALARLLDLNRERASAGR